MCLHLFFFSRGASLLVDLCIFRTLYDLIGRGAYSYRLPGIQSDTNLCRLEIGQDFSSPFGTPFWDLDLHTVRWSHSEPRFGCRCLVDPPYTGASCFRMLTLCGELPHHCNSLASLCLGDRSMIPFPEFIREFFVYFFFVGRIHVLDPRVGGDGFVRHSVARLS